MLVVTWSGLSYRSSNPQPLVTQYNGEETRRSHSSPGGLDGAQQSDGGFKLPTVTHVPAHNINIFQCPLTSQSGCCKTCSREAKMVQTPLEQR